MVNLPCDVLTISFGLCVSSSTSIRIDVYHSEIDESIVRVFFKTNKYTYIRVKFSYTLLRSYNSFDQFDSSSTLTRIDVHPNEIDESIVNSFLK